MVGYLWLQLRCDYLPSILGAFRCSPYSYLLLSWRILRVLDECSVSIDGGGRLTKDKALSQRTPIISLEGASFTVPENRVTCRIETSAGIPSRKVRDSSPQWATGSIEPLVSVPRRT